MRRVVRVGRVVVLAVVCAAAVGAVAYRAVAPRVAASGDWGLDIERALDVIGARPGMIAADAGAGDGYFTLPLARRVGPTGAVIANDISLRSLNRLMEKARGERLTHVRTVEGAVDDPLFPRRDLELVTVVHAFHDFDRPVEWLVNLKKYLRPGGQVAIIDRDPTRGDRDSHFWTRERILRYATSAGYQAIRPVEEFDNHLIIVLGVTP